jgi:hypothetical protein
MTFLYDLLASLLALTTLGGATQIGLLLFVMPPKVAKARTVVLLLPTVLLTNFANINHP